MHLCSFLAGDPAGPGSGGVRPAVLAGNAPETSRIRLDQVRLPAPVPRPSKIICIGLNYRDHAAETGRDLPAKPTVFAKFPTTLTGPYDPIVLPALSNAVDIETRVNGVTVRHSSTANMVFSVAALVSLLSQVMTLEPGDIIATGTPGGIGGAQNPPRFLKDGDVVEVEIERLGGLRNPVVAGPEGRSW